MSTGSNPRHITREVAHLSAYGVVLVRTNAFYCGESQSLSMEDPADDVACRRGGTRGMMWIRVSILVFTGWSLSVLALFGIQDPLTVAPEAYQLQMENEWARVVRVHYNPHQTIVSHDHPRVGTIYVYLGNSGSVRFK